MACGHSQSVQRGGFPGQHEIDDLGAGWEGAQRPLELEGQEADKREVAVGMEGQGWAGEELSPTDIEASRKTGRRFWPGRFLMARRRMSAIASGLQRVLIIRVQPLVCDLGWAIQIS